MNTAFHFVIGPLRFILNVQSSTIGFSYPRIFVGFPDNSFLNCDLYLGSCFGMSGDDWYSWFDSELKRLDTIDEVLEITTAAGINWEAFEKTIFDYYEKYKLNT